MKYFTDNLELFIQAGIILLVTIVVARTVSFLIEKNAHLVAQKLHREFGAKEETRLKIVKRSIVAAIYFIGIASALYQFPEVARFAAAMFASAAIVGIVVGIAAQSLVANLIAGFMISFSRRFNIGDTIDVEGHKGEVEEITLLHTQIKLEDGNHMLIPNKLLSELKIINFSLKKK